MDCPYPCNGGSILCFHAICYLLGITGNREHPRLEACPHLPAHLLVCVLVCRYLQTHIHTHPHPHTPCHTPTNIKSSRTSQIKDPHKINGISSHNVKSQGAFMPMCKVYLEHQWTSILYSQLDATCHALGPTLPIFSQIIVSYHLSYQNGLYEVK